MPGKYGSLKNYKGVASDWAKNINYNSSSENGLGEEPIVVNYSSQDMLNKDAIESFPDELALDRDLETSGLANWRNDTTLTKNDRDSADILIKRREKLINDIADNIEDIDANNDNDFLDLMDNKAYRLLSTDKIQKIADNLNENYTLRDNHIEEIRQNLNEELSLREFYKI